MKTNLILAGLLALLGYWYHSAEALLQLRQNELARQLDLIANNRIIIEDERDLKLHQLQWLLEDESKARFRTVLPVIDQLSGTLSKTINLSDRYAKKHIQREINQRSLDELAHEAQRALAAFESQARMSLHLFANDFGISNNQIEPLLNSFVTKDLLDDIQLSLNRKGALSDSISTLNFLKTLSAQFVTLEYEATLFFGSMYGGRRFTCFQMPYGIYPIKSPKKVGDEVSLLIVFSGYSEERDNIRVKLNGKKYIPDGQGVIQYDGYYNKGKPFVELEYIITNPLTGERDEGVAPYYFLDDQNQRAIP